MNRLVALRAAAGDVSREDAWVEVFNESSWQLDGAEPAPTPPGPPRSVEQIVLDLERDLANRGEPDVLN